MQKLKHGNYHGISEICLFFLCTVPVKIKYVGIFSWAILFEARRSVYLHFHKGRSPERLPNFYKEKL